jgi:hypothetical protein
VDGAAIADPASALAALAAGASAVVMGTRFVASDECDAHPHYKASLLAAEGRDTVLTELFDVGGRRHIACFATAPTSAGWQLVARLPGSAQRSWSVSPPRCGRLSTSGHPAR